MRSIASLKFHDAPDYNFFRSIFRPSDKNLIRQSASSSEDDEVILSLRLEKNPVAAKKNLPAVKPNSKKRINKFPVTEKRKGLRKRRANEKSKPESPVRPEVHLQPEVEVEDFPEVHFDLARAKLDLEQSLESMKNPTPAMLEQLERMKTRISDKSDTSAASGGRRRKVG